MIRKASSITTLSMLDALICKIALYIRGVCADIKPQPIFFTFDVCFKAAPSSKKSIQSGPLWKNV